MKIDISVDIRTQDLAIRKEGVVTRLPELGLKNMVMSPRDRK
jgi:hypothetical protein